MKLLTFGFVVVINYYFLPLYFIKGKDISRQKERRGREREKKGEGINFNKKSFDYINSAS